MKGELSQICRLTAATGGSYTESRTERVILSCNASGPVRRIRFVRERDGRSMRLWDKERGYGKIIKSAV